jgi:hypothetical protein
VAAGTCVMRGDLCSCGQITISTLKKLGWQTSLELARILSYRLAPPSQSIRITGKTVIRMVVPVSLPS